MAKEQVTGEIGSEKVVLNNAASEATLSNLLDQIEKMAKAQGLTAADSKKAKQNAEDLNKAQKTQVKNYDNLADEIDATSDSLQDFKSGLSKASGGLGLVVKGFGNLVSGTYNLAESFMLGGNRLSDFFGGIPVFGTVVEALDSNIDVYRNISNVGASFGNSLLDMRTSAATARLSLDSFQQLVGNNAETLAIFGSSVSSGARRFAEFSGNFRDSAIGQRFMGMGFTIEDLNDRLAGYIELEARRNRLEGLSQAQLTQGAENYLDQLDKLAKVTGMERKEAEQLILKQQQEANIRAMSNQLQGKQREQFENNIAMFENLTPTYATAFKDLLDGAAQTDEAVGLLAGLGPAATPFMEMMRDVGRGNIPVEDTLNLLATRFAPQLENTLNSIGPSAVQQLLLAGDPLGGALSGLVELLRLNNDRLGGLVEEEQDNRQAVTNTLASFEQTVTSIRSTILSTLFETDVFKMLRANLEMFAEELRGGEAVKEFINQNIVPALARFDNWLSGFFRDIRDPNTSFFDALGNAMDPVMEFLKEKFDEAFQRITDMLLGKQIEGPLQPGEERRAGGFLKVVSDFFTSDRVTNIFRDMANTIIGLFKDALLGRKLTEQEKFTDAERLRRNQLASIPSFQRSEAEKVEFQRLEDRNKQNEAIQKGLMGMIPGFRGRGEGVDNLGDLFDYQLNTGTQGIVDFGSASPAMLHGREAVLTEDQLFNMANGVFSAGTNAISSNIDQSRMNSVSHTMSDLKDSIDNLNTSMSTTANLTQSPADMSSSQSNLGTKLDQLNNTMDTVVGILADTHNVSKRQLQSNYGLSGNLQRGIA